MMSFLNVGSEAVDILIVAAQPEKEMSFLKRYSLVAVIASKGKNTLSSVMALPILSSIDACISILFGTTVVLMKFSATRPKLEKMGGKLF